jgi:hypothetical protein
LRRRERRGGGRSRRRCGGRRDQGQLGLAERIGRIDRLGRLEICNCVGGTAQSKVGKAAIVIGLDKNRIDLDCAVVVCDCTDVVALGRIAAKIVSPKISRVDLDRPTEIGDGVVGIALFTIGRASVAVCRREFRIEPDRLAEIRNGGIIILLEPMDGAAVVAEPDCGLSLSASSSSAMAAVQSRFAA